MRPIYVHVHIHVYIISLSVTSPVVFSYEGSGQLNVIWRLSSPSYTGHTFKFNSQCEIDSTLYTSIILIYTHMQHVHVYTYNQAHMQGGVWTNPPPPLHGQQGPLKKKVHQPNQKCIYAAGAVRTC